jgi:hypothetical protein
MTYFPPQLPLTGPSILVHIFSFSSTPLSLSLFPWCCSSHPSGQQNCSFAERWPCPLRLLLREAAQAPVRGTRGAGAPIRNRSPRPGARRRRELLLPVAKGAAGERELAGAVAPRGWVSSFAVRDPSQPPSSCTAAPRGWGRGEPHRVGSLPSRALGGPNRGTSAPREV